MDKWEFPEKKKLHRLEITPEQKNALLLAKSLQTKREALHYLQKAKKLCVTQLDFLSHLYANIEKEKGNT